MISKLKLSKSNSDKLLYLANKLKLRRNIVCRLALGRSLMEEESVRSLEIKDNYGFEFNRYTLTGELDLIFRSLITQHENKKISDEVYFSKYLRNHIERGIDELYSEYSKINSPVQFLLNFINKK